MEEKVAGLTDDEVAKVLQKPEECTKVLLFTFYFINYFYFILFNIFI